MASSLSSSLQSLLDISKYKRGKVTYFSGLPISYSDSYIASMKLLPASGTLLNTQKVYGKEKRSKCKRSLSDINLLKINNKLQHFEKHQMQPFKIVRYNKLIDSSSSDSSMITVEESSCDGDSTSTDSHLNRKEKMRSEMMPTASYFSKNIYKVSHSDSYNDSSDGTDSSNISSPMSPTSPRRRFQKTLNRGKTHKAALPKRLRTSNKCFRNKKLYTRKRIANFVQMAQLESDSSSEVELPSSKNKYKHNIMCKVGEHGLRTTFKPVHSTMKMSALQTPHSKTKNSKLFIENSPDEGELNYSDNSESSSISNQQNILFKRKLKQSLKGRAKMKKKTGQKRRCTKMTPERPILSMRSENIHANYISKMIKSSESPSDVSLPRNSLKDYYKTYPSKISLKPRRKLYRTTSKKRIKNYWIIMNTEEERNESSNVVPTDLIVVNPKQKRVPNRITPTVVKVEGKIKLEDKIQVPLDSNPSIKDKDFQLGVDEGNSVSSEANASDYELSITSSEEEVKVLISPVVAQLGQGGVDEGNSVSSEANASDYELSITSSEEEVKVLISPVVAQLGQGLAFSYLSLKPIQDSRLTKHESGENLEMPPNPEIVKRRQFSTSPDSALAVHHSSEESLIPPSKLECAFQSEEDNNVNYLTSPQIIKPGHALASSDRKNVGFNSSSTSITSVKIPLDPMVMKLESAFPSSDTKLCLLYDSKLTRYVNMSTASDGDIVFPLKKLGFCLAKLDPASNKFVDVSSRSEDNLTISDKLGRSSSENILRVASESEVGCKLTNLDSLSTSANAKVKKLRRHFKKILYDLSTSPNSTSTLPEQQCRYGWTTSEEEQLLSPNLNFERHGLDRSASSNPVLNLTNNLANNSNTVYDPEQDLTATIHKSHIPAADSKLTVEEHQDLGLDTSQDSFMSFTEQEITDLSQTTQLRMTPPRLSESKVNNRSEERLKLGLKRDINNSSCQEGAPLGHRIAASYPNLATQHKMQVTVNNNIVKLGHQDESLDTSEESFMSIPEQVLQGGTITPPAAPEENVYDLERAKSGLTTARHAKESPELTSHSEGHQSTSSESRETQVENLRHILALSPLSLSRKSKQY